MQLLEKVSRMEGMLSTMIDAKEIASNAKDRADSAHHRLDELRQDLINSKEKHEKQLRDLDEKLEKETTWLPKLIATGVISGLLGASITTAVALLLN